MSEKSVDQIIASALKRKAAGEDGRDELVESLASFEVELEENVKLTAKLTFPPGFLTFFNNQSATRVKTSAGYMTICRNCSGSGQFDGATLHLPVTSNNTHTISVNTRGALEEIVDVLTDAKKDWLAAGKPGAVVMTTKVLMI